MKFKSDVIFEDFPHLFCDEFAQGHQLFTSWAEFLSKMYYNTQSERPKYVYKATVGDPVKAGEPLTVHVDIGELVEVPWHELEKYM